MDMKTLGADGPPVSTVGIGCMMFGAMCDQETTNAIVDTALELGVNFFDVADIYGGPHGMSETLLGRAIGRRRAEIVLATKFGARRGGRGGAADGGGSRDYIVRAVEQSLEQLATDYIDLYQHHFPDDGTPVDETLRALEDLIRAGKVRQVGCSNYSGAQLQAAGEAARAAGLHPFVTAQNRYSLLYREVEQDLVPEARQQGVGIIPYFPLESGLLVGKYLRGEKPPAGTRFAVWGGGGAFVSDARWDAVERLQDYASSIGRSLLDLAIGWLAAQPHVTSVIAGVTKPEQVRANVAAAGWQPTAEQLETIGRLANGP